MPDTDVTECCWHQWRQEDQLSQRHRATTPTWKFSEVNFTWQLIIAAAVNVRLCFLRHSMLQTSSSVQLFVHWFLMSGLLIFNCNSGKKINYLTNNKSKTAKLRSRNFFRDITSECAIRRTFVRRTVLHYVITNPSVVCKVDAPYSQSWTFQHIWTI